MTYPTGATPPNYPAAPQYPQYPQYPGLSRRIRRSTCRHP